MAKNPHLEFGIFAIVFLDLFKILSQNPHFLFLKSSF